MVDGFPTAVWRRIEALEKAIRLRHPRYIVITVPTDASTGKPTAEGEAALAELKRQHVVSDDDLVVQIANYSDDPEQLPQLVSITS
jgi:hypothetical protein